jgi:hypothetical protein
MSRTKVIAAVAFGTLVSAMIGIQRSLLDAVHVFDGSYDIQIKSKKSLAWNIVQKSYSETYAILEEECRDVDSLRECMRTLREKDYTIDSFPWWFRTLLRDGTDRAVLHAGWHNIAISKPSLQVCAIEKIGSTEWKKLQCVAHGTEKRRGSNCRPDAMPKQPPPRMAILRDPLERFLSAFTDTYIKRLREEHCEPLDVFYQQKNMADATQTEKALAPDLAEELKIHDQFFFETYVETMPLR